MALSQGIAHWQLVIANGQWRRRFALFAYTFSSLSNLDHLCANR
jgi:hypothetical protein